MWWLSRIARRYEVLRHKSEMELEMEEEMLQHIELEAEELERTLGLDPREARRRARLAFGGVERFKEEGRDARGTRPLEDWVRDLRYAGRRLRRSPGYTLAAVLTLGVGLGAISGIFTLVDAILLRPLPYTSPEQLVAVKHAAPGLGLTETGVSTGTYLHYRSHATSLQSLALYGEGSAHYADGQDDVERVRIARAGPELFTVLDVRPVLGRLYTEGDWTPVVARPGMLDLNQQIPVLLSHDFWRRRYGGDPAVVGAVVRIDGQPREVAGVLPPTFAFPRAETQVWVLNMPYAVPIFAPDFSEYLGYGAVGRLRPGVSPARAEAELKGILPAISGVYGDATPDRMAEVQLSPTLVPLKREVIGRAATALWILFGGMAFLMLVVTANVTNLFLVRLEDRGREMVVRRAVGAGRRELSRLFVVESLLLCTGGAALGCMLAIWSLGALPLVPIELPRLEEVRFDGRVLAFTVGSAVLLALLLGLVATVRLSRLGIVAAPRGSGVGAELTRNGRRVREVLVAGQIALTLVLLVGGGLVARSFYRLMQVDRGFNAENVLTVEVGLPTHRDFQRVYPALVQRIGALPGVAHAASISSVPLSGGDARVTIRGAEPVTRSHVADVEVGQRSFTTGYFSTIGTPLLEGTAVDEGGVAGVANPVVLSAALARRLFEGDSPIGREIHLLEFDGSVSRLRSPLHVVGVVADVRDESLRADAAEILYIPILDPPVETGMAALSMTLVIRTGLPPLALAPAVRQAIREFDPNVTVGGIRTMDSLVAASTARESFVGLLLLIAAATSLCLGAVGVYGVVAYAARRRIPEIGIRLALGARPPAIVALVVRESLAVVLVGTAVGVALALAAAQVLRSLLFQVSPSDPVTFVSAITLAAMAAIGAAFLPARRAATLQPAVALRTD